MHISIFINYYYYINMEKRHRRPQTHDVSQSDDFDEGDEKGARNRKGYGLLFILFVVLMFFLAVLHKAKKDLNASMNSPPRYYSYCYMIYAIFVTIQSFLFMSAFAIPCRAYLKIPY
jgi:hypothetical protein